MTRISFLMLLACGLGPMEVAAASFQVETGSSTAQFEVGHFGSGMVKGTLGHITGAVDFDQSSKSGVADVSFDMRMVETGSAFVNAFIKSRRIFDTETYPTMSFHSSRFEFLGEHMIAVKGELTLHGVTRPVVMDVQRFACGDLPNAEPSRHQCRGEFRAAILRSDFGMANLSSIVNDEVRIAVQLTLERQPLVRQPQ